MTLGHCVSIRSSRPILDMSSFQTTYFEMKGTSGIAELLPGSNFPCSAYLRRVRGALHSIFPFK